MTQEKKEKTASVSLKYMWIESVKRHHINGEYKAVFIGDNTKDKRVKITAIIDDYTIVNLVRQYRQILKQKIKETNDHLQALEIAAHS